MMTHDDLETRLRASLRERAGDVDTTPALYERVQRQATRGAWMRRGLALAGAAAVVVGAVAVIPPLLPAGPTGVDITDTPDDVTPTEDAAPNDGATTFEAAMAQAGVAWSDGATIHVGDRQFDATVYVEDRSVEDGAGARATALAVEPGPATDDRFIAAVMHTDSGVASVGWARVGGTDGNDPADFDGIAAAAPNGDGIVFVPGDMAALAWIEGTDLRLLSPDGAFDRSQPLVGDVPDGLVAQQWVAQADGQVLIASDPEGGLWSLPMDDSNAANTGPTDPGFPLPGGEDAVDGLLRPDLARVDLEVFPDGSAPARLAAGDASPIPLPGDLASSTEVRLVGNGSWLVAVDDPTTGGGALLHLDDTGRYMPGHSWGDQEMPVTAVVPLRVEDAPASPVDLAEDENSDDVAEGNASELGLPTGSPVIGTAGTDLLVRFADAEVRTLPLYPSGESEASLGRLAVMPGSTTEYGLVAVESFSEGQNTIRFGGVRDGEVGPVGDIIVADGPVTGLVWSEDGRQIAWTDTAGLHVAAVDDAGEVAAEALLSADARPVLDWVWTGTDGEAATGHLTIGVDGGTGVDLLGVDRAPDGTVTTTGPVDGAGGDQIVLDTHAAPGAGEGPSVIADLAGGATQLGWFTDTGEDGVLADPGQLGGDVRVEVSGGHVLVMGDSRQVLVTFDGEVVDLPTAADWDVLD